eukprot:SM000082S22821  [mRNA]  locus=s82:167414:168838:- [translate_table: standard]
MCCAAALLRPPSLAGIPDSTAATSVADADAGAIANSCRGRGCTQQQKSPQLATLRQASSWDSRALGRTCGAHKVRPDVGPSMTATAAEAAAAVDDPPGGRGGVVVKICGVASPEDGVAAVAAGASLVGMILWPKSKRSVSLATAAEISRAVRSLGAETVGVFVDEDAATIARASEAAGVSYAQSPSPMPHLQLHGDRARAALPHLPPDLRLVYVMQADSQGVLHTPPPLPRLPWLTSGASPGQSGRVAGLVDWILVDGLQGGSGERFDWSNLAAPQGLSRRGWLLAGGLEPSNVAEAVALLHPDGVDVSSGVTGPDKIAKDPAKIAAFAAAVQACLQLREPPQLPEGADRL